MANLNSTLINGNLRITGESILNTANISELSSDDIATKTINISDVGYAHAITFSEDKSSRIYESTDTEKWLVFNTNGKIIQISTGNGTDYINASFANFPKSTTSTVASEQWTQQNFYSLNGGTLNGSIYFNQTGNGIQFASEGTDTLKICSTVNGSNSDILFYAKDDNQDGFIFRLNKYQVGDIDIMDIHNTGVTIGQTNHNVPLTVNGDATFAGSSITLKCPIIIDSGTFNNNGKVFLQITDDYGLMDVGNFSVGFKALGSGVSNLKFRFMNTSNTAFDYTFPTQSGTIALTSNLNGYATQSWVKSSGQKYSMSFSNDTLTITENF